MTFPLSTLPAKPETAVPPPERRKNRTRLVDTVTATAFLTPGMLAFFTFVIVPVIGGLVLSFFSWNLFGDITWVGFDNVQRLFRDPQMWQALAVTLIFVVMGVIPTILVGFMLAVLVNVKLPGIGALRILYLAPMIASAAVASVIWATLYNPRIGFINQALSWVGIEGPNWLSDPNWARPALVLMMIWGALPLVIILYLAGLQRVSEDIYAAASLDGAGKWRQLWSMTWPNVMPTTALVAVLQMVGFISGSFEIALIMTGGGPLGTTQTLALYSYRMAFEQRDIGYASALSLFQLLLIAVAAAIVLLVRKQRKSRA